MLPLELVRNDIEQLKKVAATVEYFRNKGKQVAADNWAAYWEMRRDQIMCAEVGPRIAMAGRFPKGHAANVALLAQAKEIEQGLSKKP